VTDYFAYGSNMNSVQMAERCPGAVSLGVARLDGFALAFDRWSHRRSGYVADVLPSPGATVWGVLWRVTREHLLSLDRYEGVAGGAYRREAVHVSLATEPPREVEAVVYRVCQPDAPGPPSAPYLNLMLEGAREHVLPPAYIANLAASASLGGTGQKS
jgi:gamma-glutamylcyclotransferase